MAERGHSAKSPDSKKLRKGEEEETTDGKQDQHQKKTGLAGAARWVKKRATGQPKSSSVQSAQYEEMESTAADDTPETHHRLSQDQPPPPVEKGQWDSWQRSSSIAVRGSSQHVNSRSTASSTHGSVLDDSSTSEYQDKPSPDQYTPVASSAEGTSDYDRLDPAEMKRDVEHGRPYTQPLSMSRHQSESIYLAAELAKAELERDQCKRDIEDKESQIQEYQLEIVKLKTQARTSSPRQQQQSVVPDHSAVVQLEEKEKEIVELNRELVEGEARIKQLRREMEMQGDVAVNVACKEMKKEITELKQSLAQKERELTAFNETTGREPKDTLLKERLKNKEKEFNELQSVNLQLERKLAAAKMEVDFEKERTQENQTKTDELKRRMDELEKESGERLEEIQRQKARITHLTEQLRIQETATGEAHGNIDTERREKERLQREVKELKKESAQSAILATRGIERMEEEYGQQLEEKDRKYRLELNVKDQQIRNLGDEMMTVRAELEKAQKLVQELDHNLGEEMKEESHTQAGVIDEGASANNSLSDEDKEKRALETRIGELDEQLTKLEADKRAFQHQLTEKETAVKEQDEKLQQMKQLLIQQATALNHEKDKLSQENDELKRKFTEATSALETLQTVKGENEKNRELIQAMTQCNEKFVRDRQTCERQLYDAKKRLDDKCEELRKCELEKVRLRAELKKAIEEKNQTVTHMEKQLEDQMTSAKEAKEEAVTEVFAKLQLKEQECAIYKLDFEGERNDRERIHQTLTGQLEQVTGQCEELKQQLSEALKRSETDMQALTDAELNIQQLTERNTELDLENESFRTQHECIQSELTQVQEQLAKEQKQCQSLWKKITESEQLTKLIVEEKEKVQTEKTEVSQELNRAQQNIQELNKAKKSLQAEIASLMKKNTEEADKAKTQGEEIQILTAQVNAYSRKGDELKRALTQSQEIYKTLESDKKTFETEASQLRTALSQNQEKYKTVETKAIELENALTQSQERYKTLETDKKTSEEQLEDQLTIMRQQLDSLTTSKGQLLTAFNKEQERVTSLKQEVSKLEDLYGKTKSANQTLVQKLKAYEQSGSPQPQIRANNMSQAEAPPTNITIRRNDTAAAQNLQAPVTSTGGSHNQEQVVTAQSKGGAVYPIAANEPSDSATDDIRPVMNKEQMTQFFKVNQTEKDKERQQLDDELRELDYAREHGIPASTATTDPVSQANFVSGREEKSHDDDTDSDNEVWPENKLIEGIDQEIQYYADQVRQMSRRPDTAEVELSDEDDSLPYDPNLVCPKCGKRYRIGGVQKFRRHVKELCTASS